MDSKQILKLDTRQSIVQRIDSMKSAISAHRLKDKLSRFHYFGYPGNVANLLVDKIPTHNSGDSKIAVMNDFGLEVISILKDKGYTNLTLLCTEENDKLYNIIEYMVKKEFNFTQVKRLQDIDMMNDKFDLVIANHLLFYCDDVECVCKEVKRVLKDKGRFICSTYGRKHMKEITELVQTFDSRILLAGENLYERFGLENGGSILNRVFSQVDFMRYDDYIELNKPELLLEYILSCHGNQNQLLLDKYKEFKHFVTEKTRYGFHITKDAGIFISR